MDAYVDVRSRSIAMGQAQQTGRQKQRRGSDSVTAWQAWTVWRHQHSTYSLMPSMPDPKPRKQMNERRHKEPRYNIINVAQVPPCLPR